MSPLVGADPLAFAGASLIEGGLAAEVIGTNVYGYWNRLIYAEAGVYKTLSTRTQTTLGVDPTGSSSLKGVAPYWRLAIEPKWGPNSLEAGVFGMAATLNPGRITGFGTDHAVDIGIDTQVSPISGRRSQLSPVPGQLDHSKTRR